jgi:hypothetical protein
MPLVPIEVTSGVASALPAAKASHDAATIERAGACGRAASQTQNRLATVIPAPDGTGQ